jgi:hypothetical protein
MIALMMLVGISRCAAPDVCPSDEELLAAVRGRDDAALQQAVDDAAQNDPGRIVMIHGERIRRISVVLCGEAMARERPDEPPAVLCRFTVRYWSRDAHSVARMVKRPDGWEIDEALSVSRERR